MQGRKKIKQQQTPITIYIKTDYYNIQNKMRHNRLKNFNYYIYQRSKHYKMKENYKIETLSQRNFDVAASPWLLYFSSGIQQRQSCCRWPTKSLRFVERNKIVTEMSLIVVICLLDDENKTEVRMMRV